LISDEAPDYVELIRLGKLKKSHASVLFVIARRGGRARFSDILADLGGEKRISKSTLSNRLNALAQMHVITYGKGLAELTYKSTLCYIADANIPYAYVGLLGMKNPNIETESETETAVKLLEQEGINPEKICVATTPEALESWKDFMNEDTWRRIELIQVKVTEMNNIEKMINRIKPKLHELMKNYITILDCTSGTRPAGIALYTLAEKYKLPLIYIYKDTKQIHWLKTKQTIKRELEPIF